MSEQTPLEEAAKALLGNTKPGEMGKLLGSPILWGIAGFFIGMYSCKGKIKKLEEKISELEKRLEAKEQIPPPKYEDDLGAVPHRGPRKRAVSILN